MQKILSLLRKCDEEYKLIENGDKIGVGVSGGKDSMVLLKALSIYRKFDCKNFELCAITVDMYNNTNLEKLQEFCKEIDVPLHIIRTNIYDVVFEERKEKNPCSLCSKMRRGALSNKAKELGITKLALGHTLDDIIQTFFLSMIYEGRLSTFMPKTYMSKTKITVIRPLVFTDEKFIKSASKDLPIFKNPCPANKHTKREFVKELIDGIKKDVPFAKDRIFTALVHPERYNLLNQMYGKKGKPLNKKQFIKQSLKQEKKND